MSPTPATTGRMPDIFDYQDDAFLTGATPVTELLLVRPRRAECVGI